MSSKDEQVTHEVLKSTRNISFEGKQCVIFGGAGFIGSWVCEVLLQKNAKVVCIDNFSSGRKSNISHLMGHENFELYDHDVSNPLNISYHVDYVIHMASRASPLEFDKFPIQILRSNILGTINALEIAKKYNSRFLFTSTSEVYGDAQVIPTQESYNGNVNPIGIRGCYDEGKRAGEALCMAYLREHNVDIRIARIFNTYGPRMRFDGHYGRVIPRFICQALQNRPLTIFGDGLQTRSFCYIADQVEALLKLLAYDGGVGDVINIGNPGEVTIKHLAEVIIDITQSESSLEYQPLPSDDPRRRNPNIMRAIQKLDWEPRTSLRQGLKKTVRYYQRELATADQ